jgi:hypothetical protein
MLLANHEQQFPSNLLEDLKGVNHVPYAFYR